MRTNAKNNTAMIGLVVALLATSVSCVEHREIRNGVFNENVYLEKDFLTRENPNKVGSRDTSWLAYSVLVKSSSVGDFGSPFVGYYSQPKHVGFRFNKDKLEVLDDTDLLATEGVNSAIKTVINAWDGEHVDIKLRVNLDGEISNFKEENKEAPWQDRQYFKLNLEKAAREDVAQLNWWFTAYGIGQCLEVKSVSLVPGSVVIEDAADKEGEEKGDDFISWTVAVTYAMKVLDGGYVYNVCYNKLADLQDRSTFTFQFKHSFWRLPQSDYEPLELAEKDPIRKKLGAFETMRLYRDEDTELHGATTFVKRFDPAKPHTLYFSPSFPEKYKEHFTKTITEQVNGIMEKAGAAMRISFVDWNHDGKERQYGDPRYSFLTYHNVAALGGRLIGMAPTMEDPRTGEILSATLNMYNWRDRLNARLVQDYLAQVTDDTPESDKYQGKCTPGEKVKIDAEKIIANHAGTSLYSKLEDYMEEPATGWVRDRSDDFHKYMRMLLPDLRFAVPGWNTFVNAEDFSREYSETQARVADGKRLFAGLERGENPFGTMDLGSSRAIDKGLETIARTKAAVKDHFQLQRLEGYLHKRAGTCTIEGWELYKAMALSARLCKEDGTWETREEWIDRTADGWFKALATHEFGHNLGLRHNFYGSLDTAHMGEGSLTSSIMEYTYTLAEGAEEPVFKAWDEMALKWIYSGGKVAPKEDENWLYCTDEHSYFSPLCTTHDIGTTPTEIVKNVIDMYEWNYRLRNFRAYRKFWDTSGYSSSMLNRLYPLRRLLNLWGLDWYEEGIKNNLSLLGVEGDERFFANITNEFNDEMAQANRLIVNFYKAILQQSAGERSYATKFDKFYGDVTQQGIIMDKYFAMFMAMGLWPVDDYDQNVYAYIAYHEYAFNSLFYSDAQDVADSMIGGQYDVYPWFKPLAVLLFAQDTHDINFSDRSKREWIEMRKYERLEDMVDVYGLDPRAEALKTDNPFQLWRDKQGREWVYYYLADRNQHLVASKDRNPVAFKILKDQNERINLDKSGSASDYEIKYYLDYYQYFN